MKCRSRQTAPRGRAPKTARGFPLVEPARKRPNYGAGDRDLWSRLLAVRHPDVLDLRGAAQELAPLALASDSQSRAGRRRPGRLQVAGRGRLDRGARRPSAPKYQSASTSSCSASVLASASRSPVTMLTTPPGTSRGVEHLVEVGRRQRMRSRRHRDHAVAHRDAPAPPARRSRAAAPRPGRRCRSRRPARSAPAVTPRDRRLVHRAVVLVGPGGVGEQALDRRLALRASASLRRAGHARRAAPRIRRRAPPGSRRCSTAPARGCAPVALAQPPALCAASTALRMSLRLPSPTSAERRRRRRRATARL